MYVLFSPKWTYLSSISYFRIPFSEIWSRYVECRKIIFPTIFFFLNQLNCDAFLITAGNTECSKLKFSARGIRSDVQFLNKVCIFFFFPQSTGSTDQPQIRCSRQWKNLSMLLLIKTSDYIRQRYRKKYATNYRFAVEMEDGATVSEYPSFPLFPRALGHLLRLEHES